MQIRKNHTPSKVEKLFTTGIEAILYGSIFLVALAIPVAIGRGIWWIVTGQ